MDGALSIVWNQRRCPGFQGQRHEVPARTRAARHRPVEAGRAFRGKRRACGRVANGRAARDPLRPARPAPALVGTRKQSSSSARFVPASSECRHGQRPSRGYGQSTSDRSRTEGRCCSARGQVDLDCRWAMIGVANGFARTRIGCGSSGTCGRLADLRPYGRHPARRIMHRPAFRANSRATAGS
jgi:hypothetical protein